MESTRSYNRLMFILYIGGFWLDYNSKNKLKVIAQVIESSVLYFFIVYQIYYIYSVGVQVVLSKKLFVVPSGFIVIAPYFCMSMNQRGAELFLIEYKEILETDTEFRGKYEDKYAKLWKYLSRFGELEYILSLIFHIIPLSIETISYLIGYNEFTYRVPMPIEEILWVEPGRLNNYLTLAFGTVWAVSWVTCIWSLTSALIMMHTYTLFELKLFKDQLELYKDTLVKSPEIVFKKVIDKHCKLIKLV